MLKARDGVGFHVLLAALMFVALLLRLHQLDHESLFMDELRQVSYYTEPLGRVTELAIGQQQPPLDYWIGHGVFRFSQSDFAARLPAALFGTLSVLLLALLVAAFASPAAGLLAGLVMALSPFHLYFSQEARPYMIALCLLLAVLLALDRLLNAPRARIVDAALLLLATTLFLFSRSLTPLVIVASLTGLLGLGLAGRLLHPVSRVAGGHARWLLAMASLALALLIYLPLFRRILAGGARFAPDAASDPLAMLGVGLERFDPSVLWPVLSVQLEPLLWCLPLLALVGLVVAGRHARVGSGVLALLLPVAALMQVFIYQASTQMPFRPPYPVYVLPLSLFLALLGGVWLWRQAGGTGLAGLARGGLLLVAGAGLALSAQAAWQLKQSEHRSDWKGLAGHLERDYGEQYFLVFDALAEAGHWEPGFYQFDRYYRGHARGGLLKDLPTASEHLPRAGDRPVLVLFQKPDYLLTPASRHSMFPSPGWGPLINLAPLAHHAGIKAHRLNGFWVLSRRGESQGFARDLLYLLETALPLLPQESLRVDWHLAMAYLRGACGLPGLESQLTEAARLNNPAHARQLELIASLLRFLHTRPGLDQRIECAGDAGVPAAAQANTDSPP